MKKVWLVVALAALGATAVNTFADVQNIRLSGDIRLRGYYLNRADSANQSDAAFISQRTRVSVEADLEDHVLVVVTLAGESLWGGTSETANTSGAGSALGDPLNRKFDVGIDEAYVQMNEVFYTPATLKIGRQYLNYGRGLIISSVDQEYNYDAARMIIDKYPLTLDVVGAQLVNSQTFSSDSTSTNSANLLFVNAHYEMSDSAIKDIEGYFGWAAQMDKRVMFNNRAIPLALGASPMIIGARTDINLTEQISCWAEGAYEFGQDGYLKEAGFGTNGKLGSWIANAGIKIGLKDTQWTPTLNGSYTYAGQHFLPWFDYVDGYNGYLFAPALNNIHIFNVGGSIKPYENTTMALQAYYYMKADHNSPAGTNPNYDFGGPGFSTWGAANGDTTSADLGWEIDGILGYDYSKDVRAQFVYGAFIPGNSFTEGSEVSRVAHELRAELNVKF